MSKPVDHQVGGYLQKLLREWLAADPSRNEVQFAVAAKLSKATVNNLKNKGVGAGSKTVAGFARVLNMTPAQIYAAAAGEVTRHARFRDLPQWSEMEARLRATPRGRSYPEAAWRAAGGTSSDVAPVGLDDFTILQLVDFWAHVIPGDATPASEPRPVAKAS